MLGEKIQKALNEQINAELHSAYLYYSMAAYLESGNWRGAAKWMRAQAMEEMVHADKLFSYIVERGGRVTLQPISEVKTEWASPRAAFEAAYQHEQGITARINKLVDAAAAEKDHATSIFLQWFVTEQVEEEGHADDVVNKWKMVEGSTGGQYMLDKELGKRVFAKPSA